MKRLLVLGAGLISRPLVQYLLDQNDYFLTVANLTGPEETPAEAYARKHEKGDVQFLDVNHQDALEKKVAEHDITISLLPYTYHPIVARFCLKHTKHLIAPSYVSEEMSKLDKEAKNLGLTFLNEIGLDPGIDHMSAMKIINDIESQGGKVIDFYSYCGGLPSPENNDNPWGYKFSWSPRGVIMAGKNNARYLKDGKEVMILGTDLFENHWLVPIQGYGELEAYPNRDSIPYQDIYNLKHVQNMLRGTLRNLGWCYTMKKLSDINFFDLDEIVASNMTYADMIRHLTGVQSYGADLKQALADFIEVHIKSDTMKRLDWLGLLSDESILTNGATKVSPLDVLANKMEEKLKLQEGQLDFCVMQHEIVAEYPNGAKEKTYSTLLECGIPDGDSAMARTVSLPAAIGAKLILENNINEKGVIIPVKPSVYNPILRELETGGNIVFKERVLTSPEQVCKVQRP